MAKRRQNALVLRSIIAFLILVIVILGIILVRKGVLGGAFSQMRERAMRNSSGVGHSGSGAVQDGTEMIEEATESQDTFLMDEAQRLAAQYEYQEAIDLLKSSPQFNINTRLQNAAASYQAQKDSCRSYPLDEITHIFFHTLIKDTSKAFDGDGNEAGYNQVMTTISEFNSIIEQMYEKGYVMVSLHDMCQVNEDGTVSRKEIRLPEGKIPFVLSQDDVSYYHYMVGDGFARNLIVDRNGDIRNEYVEDDGSISVGDYDMVPLIDRFVEKHPDFSYHGHKGIVALTGYEGVLGYRTDEVYKTREDGRVTAYQKAFLDANPDFDYDAEVQKAKKVADAMKAEGWEFASHTWGHINPAAFGYNATVQDTTRWLENVGPIVGDTDVLIFAFGADINDWRPYTHDNEIFDYLKGKGFSIYCNVDSSQVHWVQFGDDFMRQGRRNLDGYRMYYSPELIEDLFDVEKAWDKARPTPVPEM